MIWECLACRSSAVRQPVARACNDPDTRMSDGAETTGSGALTEFQAILEALERGERHYSPASWPERPPEQRGRFGSNSGSGRCSDGHYVGACFSAR
jgi:hypothetical protein